MSHGVSTDRRQADGSVPAGRLRVNHDAGLTLSTTWQDVPFTGSSTRNVNTFMVPSAASGLDTSRAMVMYDATAKLFRFQGIADKTYDLLFNTKSTSSSILSALNLTLASIQLRFVVPSPTPVYFPLPDSDGCVDITKAGLTSTDRGTYYYIFPATAAVQQYGLGVQMRVSNTFLATATINAADLLIYGR